VKAELAYTLQLHGDEEESAKLYEQAADAAPQDVGLQLSAAQAQLGLNNIESAEQFLGRAEKIEPDHYRLHAIRGQIARLEERDQNAVQEYSAALSHLPQAPPEGPLYAVQLHLYLVELYQRLQDPSAARSQLALAQSQIGGMNVQGKGRQEFLRVRALTEAYADQPEVALRDINEALALNAKDPNALQLDGDLLVRLKRPEEALQVYKKVLAIDPDNRFALLSLGSVSRELGRDQDAEKYLRRLAAAYPKLYAPYLALGDLYTARRDFPRAQTAYHEGHKLAPNNALIVAGGMNAAIEAHQFPLAGEWLNRATPEMRQNAQIMRETERYLTWTGRYKEAAEVASEAIKKLPRDRDVVVYLGYDLLNLERYDELLKLTSDYADALPREPALPLLAGYVHKHNGDLELANEDFTRAIARDPKVVTAYVNRGYVLHDLHKPEPAAADFEAALRMEPKNGEAHLGLAYANLDRHRPRAALQQARLAEQQLGDSLALHLIRGTAYGDEGKLASAAREYQAALRYAPRDAGLHLALASTLYDQREYSRAIAEFQAANQLSSEHGMIDAQIARAYAQLGDRDQTLAYAEKAEKEGPSSVLISTGEALSLIGDHDAAMARYERALAAPDADRINVRLAIARLMTRQNEWDDARRQIALALMEARVDNAPPPTGTQFSEAADLFLTTHDFPLAETYFQRALAAGAPESSVRVGLANTYLALGDTPRAEGQLSALDQNGDDNEANYPYLLAKASLYRQQHQNTQALSTYAQAASVAGEDLTASEELLRASGDEGLRINHHLSLLSNFSVAPIFEDTTTYTLDAKLDTKLPFRQNLLPLPRSSIETQWTGAYHLHLNGLPEAGGFFQVRNAQGDISVPSANAIVNRNTTDYAFNFGLNPTLHLGNNVLSFNSGIQETIRRDSSDPFDMNQNLFRQFLYLSTSSFFNWVAVNGYAIREAGPFTEQNQHSRDLVGALEFKIGRPWNKTALVTGWIGRDDLYRPFPREFYFTSSYLGVERKFSDRFQLRAVGEYVRAWRVEGSQFAIAQAARPSVTMRFSPTRNWSVQGLVAYSRNMGTHFYDAVQSGFAVSYCLPIQRGFEENGVEVPMRYPIRFSAGMQQETFFNFPVGNQSQQFRPYIQISIF